MNAAAAIAVCGEVESPTGIGGSSALREAANIAEVSLDSGQALAKLEQLIELTRSFG